MIKIKEFERLKEKFDSYFKKALINSDIDYPYFLLLIIIV